MGRGMEDKIEKDEKMETSEVSAEEKTWTKYGQNYIKQRKKYKTREIFLNGFLPEVLLLVATVKYESLTKRG